jgi:hypothetical protein
MPYKDPIKRMVYIREYRRRIDGAKRRNLWSRSYELDQSGVVYKRNEVPRERRK